MMTKHGNDYPKFKEDVKKLWPILKEMNSRGTRIIWWNQDPPAAVPFDDNFEFPKEKLEHYNDIAKTIFKYK